MEIHQPKSSTKIENRGQKGKIKSETTIDRQRQDERKERQLNVEVNGRYRM